MRPNCHCHNPTLLYSSTTHTHTRTTWACRQGRPSIYTVLRTYRRVSSTPHHHSPIRVDLADRSLVLRALPYPPWKRLSATQGKQAFFPFFFFLFAFVMCSSTIFSTVVASAGAGSHTHREPHTHTDICIYLPRYLHTHIPVPCSRSPQIMGNESFWNVPWKGASAALLVRMHACVRPVTLHVWRATFLGTGEDMK